METLKDNRRSSRKHKDTTSRVAPLPPAPLVASTTSVVGEPTTTQVEVAVTSSVTVVESTVALQEAPAIGATSAPTTQPAVAAATTAIAAAVVEVHNPTQEGNYLLFLSTRLISLQLLRVLILLLLPLLPTLWPKLLVLELLPQLPLDRS